MYFIRCIALLLFLAGIPTIFVSAQPGGARPSGQAKLQTGKLTGRIVDAQKNPVSYATVALLRMDSSVVNGALTDDKGNFTIEPTGSGSFMLRISGISVAQQTIGNIKILPSEQEKNLGNITVGASANALKTVEIVSERPVMEMSVDKKVFNVEKNTTATGGSAADVLQNVPSVSVDAEGNVSLRGKSGVTIFIDGKPATLLGGDINSALQSMPASSIQNVEVITNPSAKYDAQGMTGIINIVTKKDKRMGFNGNVSAGVGTRDKYNASIGLNLRNDKWNIFLNSSFRKNRNYHRFTTDRKNYYNDSTFYSFEDNTRDFGGYFNTLGGEYTIDKNNSITVTENINIMRFGGGTVTDFWSRDGGVPYAHQLRYAKRTGGPVSISSSVNYKHKFAKPGQEISTDLTYVTSNSKNNQTYNTYSYDGNEVAVKQPLVQKQPSQGVNNSFNGQIDYTMPFISKTGKLDAGVKSQMWWFESSNEPVLDSGSGEQVDYILLSDYKYTQQVNAGYLNFNDQAGKWSYQAGLRVEQANYEGTSKLLGGQKYGYNFLNLFPSAFLSYKLPKDQTVYLNYTRRINRPNFWQMMPYFDLSNPQDTQMGNPNLRPEFINNTEFNYNKQFKKGHNIIASAYYQYTENLIERIRRFYENGTSFTQNQNVSSATTFGLELTGRLQLTTGWDATFNVNFFQNKIQGQNVDPALNNSGSSWLGKFNTNYKLPKNFSVQLMGNYEAPKIATQGRLGEAWWIDIAVRKSFWNNKASLVVNVTDIFDTRKYWIYYEYPSYIQTNYRDRETRIGNITFSYRFGKDNSGGNRSRRQGNQNGAKDRNNLKSDDGGDGGF
ncbi:MAG: TonB-dependent receptor [Sphingobacteriales bacterium]|nr:MAG: TonB-dependent receptor [Sphingobacteriales bacterium]